MKRGSSNGAAAVKLAKLQQRVSTATSNKRQQLAALNEKFRNYRKEEGMARKGETAGAVLGQHVVAFGQGQVFNELANKRGRVGLARVIGYGLGLGGIVLAIKARRRIVRVGGMVLTGASVAQLAIDTHTIDLIPGLNQEEEEAAP